ncbi:recombinase family protein [Micromonospora tarensis]|uniref:recombinase family protein n=1 Tax=Micromonospora tarensis TaxID=2806100 RepID=UPI003898F4B0
MRLHPAGSRPPPQPAKAADGKHLRGLTPDPRTAPIVRQIFREFLTGSGLYAIAEALTSNHVPCPSAHDRARNPTAAASPGPRAPSASSSPTPATQAGRSGTTSALKRSSWTSTTSRSVTPE